MVGFGDVMDLIPSWSRRVEVSVAAVQAGPRAGRDEDEAVCMPVAASGPVPQDAGVTREALSSAGFDGKVGQTRTGTAADGGLLVLYGIGEAAAADADALREAASAAARAADRHTRLALVLPEGIGAEPAIAAQALVEGALLARYRYDVLKTAPAGSPMVEAVTVLASAAQTDSAAVTKGAERGALMAAATALSRDLANCPPSLMTAAVMAQCAQRLGADRGLEVEAVEHHALQELGCGGLLGVNAGSADPPRMIILRYTPSAGGGTAAPKLALVGKGIMYDSGGISLKPSDAVHATMKNDMTGAGSILASMSVLKALDCDTAVTAYLMCTDNMPSGTATKLGDVLVIHGGTTVEVVNTDAEGRLVMADALVLAAESDVDAIVDIATLTGASMRALGTEIAGVFGNDEELIEQVLSAGEATGEPGWQLPMARRYRGELDSDVADIKNMGGPNGGAIHAALFLEEFVADKPWAHIDIAGPAQSDSAVAWRTKGCTGFGARLLTELALGFTRPEGRPADQAKPAGAGAKGGQ